MPKLTQGMYRLGTETAFDVLARAEQLKSEGRDIINLGIGQPDFKTPPHIVEAAIKALRDGQHGYTPGNGIKPLREAVAVDLERRYSIGINPDHVVVVPGGKVTMFFAILMFGEPGAEILYPNPGFPIYESMINYTGAKPVAIPLLEKNCYTFDANAVLKLITSNTRLIILNTPSNPTGSYVPKEQLNKLAEGLEAHPNVHILSDEIYSQMLYGDRRHTTLLSYENLRERVIMLDGWSKTYAMTGWRLGYAVWPTHLVEPATRLAINCHSCVNAATQFAGIAALTGSQDDVHNMVAEFDRRRDVTVKALNALPGISCVEPDGAFYAFANITGTGTSALEAQNRFLELAGVATVAGTSFGKYGEGHVRFSYANSIENICLAIDRIQACL